MRRAQSGQFTPLISTIQRSIRARQHNRRKIPLVSRIYRCGLLIGPHFLALSTVGLRRLSLPEELSQRTRGDACMKSERRKSVYLTFVTEPRTKDKRR